MIASGFFAVILGYLNLKINRLHENRFDAHVAAASYALYGLERALPIRESVPSLSQCRGEFNKIKTGSLSGTWAAIPQVVIVAGLMLALAGVLCLGK